MDADARSRLADALTRDPRVVFAYLFGSQATGGAGSRSDVDVAVWLSGHVRDRAFDATLELMEVVGDSTGTDAVDVVVLNTASLSLAAEILKGQLLCSKDEDVRIDAEASIMSRYHDRLPRLRRHLDAAGARLAERGWS